MDIDLYALSIERYDHKDGHSSIDVVASTDWNSPAVVEQYTFTERVAAARHITSIVARAAAEVACHLADAVRRCGCSGQRFSGCRMSVDSTGPVFQIHDEDERPIPGRYRLQDNAPVLDIRIPTGEADRFVRYVEDALAEIAECDAFEITDESEYTDWP